MLQKSDIHAYLPDTALSAYFRNAGDLLAEESALLGAAIRSILASDGHLTNKAIILRLINALESVDDVVASDIIRKTLEIVVDHTSDDI
ncbi:biofilm development regulator YmgB/AriR family protein [Dryocola sp. BD613]|uniref:biofilm development regulator YmgB/AriR family protein n=1 Tax=Dryocola sp. BD613 TaxID=3133272 RepID=UPI003F4FDDAC